MLEAHLSDKSEGLESHILAFLPLQASWTPQLRYI